MPSPPTPPNTTTSKPKSKGGQFTGQDLAAAVDLSPDLAKLAAGTPINDVEMEKILATRISGGDNVGGGDDFERGRDLAEVIIDALPPELHNADVANALDFRPYLQALDGKKIVFRSHVVGPFLPDITKAKTVHTDKWIKLENERLAGDAIVAGGGTTKPPPTGFETGTAGVTPQVPTTDAAGKASGITVDANGNIVLPTGGKQDAVRFPIEGLRAAVQSGTMSLEELAATESNYLLDNPDSRDYFGVDVGKPTAPMPGVPAQSTDTIGALDALKYLYDLTPAEVHNMQLKMAAAGYFDKLDNGGSYIDGDPTDHNTQAAWNLLLKDSITTKRSVPAVLGDGLRNYREQTRKTRLGQLSEVDPSYVRMLANDFGQSTIGRDLTGQETDDLIHHLDTLRIARAGSVAGTPQTTGRLPGDEQNQGYTANDVQQYEMARTAKEQRDNNQRSISFAMSKLVK